MSWEDILPPVIAALIIQLGMIVIGYFKLSSKFETYREKVKDMSEITQKNQNDLIRLDAQVAALKESQKEQIRSLRDTLAATQSFNEENFAKIEDKLDKIESLLIKKQ